MDTNVVADGDQQADPQAIVDEVERRVRSLAAQLDACRPEPDRQLAEAAAAARREVAEPARALHDLVEVGATPGDRRLEEPQAERQVRRRQGTVGPVYRRVWGIEVAALTAELDAARDGAQKWEEPSVQVLERAARLELARLPAGVGEPLLPLLAGALERFVRARDGARRQVDRLGRELRRAQRQATLEDHSLLPLSRSAWIWPTAAADLEPPRRGLAAWMPHPRRPRR